MCCVIVGMNKLLGELSFVVHLSRSSVQILINQNVLHNDPYSIGCVMVTMVASSLDLVKPKSMTLVFTASLLSTQH